MLVYQRVTPKYPKLYNPKTTISDHFHWENPLPDPVFWGFHLFNNKIGKQTKNLMQIPLKYPSVFFHCCFQNLQCWYCFLTTFSSSNFSIFQKCWPFFEELICGSRGCQAQLMAGSTCYGDGHPWEAPAQRPESDAPLRVAADPWGEPPYLAAGHRGIWSAKNNGLLGWAMGKIRDSTA